MDHAMVLPSRDGVRKELVHVHVLPMGLMSGKMDFGKLCCETAAAATNLWLRRSIFWQKQQGTRPEQLWTAAATALQTAKCPKHISHCFGACACTVQ